MDISEQPDTGRGPTYRAALIAVIILSILLFIGIIALVAGFMRQYAILQASHGAAGTQVPALITLAPGARIVSVETQPGRLILHVTTPKGDEVEVMDLGSGRLLTRIKPP